MKMVFNFEYIFKVEPIESSDRQDMECKGESEVKSSTVDLPE